MRYTLVPVCLNLFYDPSVDHGELTSSVTIHTPITQWNIEDQMKN